MRQEIQFNLDKEPFVAAAAADLLGLDVGYLIRQSSKGPFKYQGITVERITPLKKKPGTEIVRDDGVRWSRIKDCAAATGLKAPSIAAWIRAKQCFDFDGHHYKAVNYKPIHRNFVGKRKRVGIEVLNTENLQALSPVPTDSGSPSQQEVIETIDYEVNKKIQEQLSTEEKCEALLQELTIERTRNKDYKGAAKALKALDILTDIEQETTKEEITE